jgi:hypothetical protein
MYLLLKKGKRKIRKKTKGKPSKSRGNAYPYVPSVL